MLALDHESRKLAEELHRVRSRGSRMRAWNWNGFRGTE